MFLDIYPEYTCSFLHWLDEYTSNHKLQNMDGTMKWNVFMKASAFEYMSVKPDVLPNIVENESICIWSIPKSHRQSTNPNVNDHR